MAVVGSVRIVLIVVDLFAQAILLTIDDLLLLPGQMSAVERPVGADFLIDRRLFLFDIFSSSFFLSAWAVGSHPLSADCWRKLLGNALKAVHSALRNGSGDFVLRDDEA
jgi:hypothetical protein